MSKVIRLETGEEPEWFFDLEDKKSSDFSVVETRPPSISAIVPPHFIDHLPKPPGTRDHSVSAAVTRLHMTSDLPT